MLIYVHHVCYYEIAKKTSKKHGNAKNHLNFYLINYVIITSMHIVTGSIYDLLYLCFLLDLFFIRCQPRIVIHGCILVQRSFSGMFN